MKRIGQRGDKLRLVNLTVLNLAVDSTAGSPRDEKLRIVQMITCEESGCGKGSVRVRTYAAVARICSS